jgi:hypothetical protein
VLGQLAAAVEKAEQATLRRNRRQPPAAGAERAKETARPAPAASSPPVQKVRATFHIPLPLLEEARNAVVHLAGPPLRLTLAALAERARRAELDRLKRDHNAARDFPRHAAPLKGGRPIRMRGHSS